MFRLRSAIDTYPECIDIRYLTMEGEFYCLFKAEADSFLLSFWQYINDFSGDQCVYSWNTVPHCPGFATEPARLFCGENIMFGAEGAVRGDTIAKKAAFRKWNHELCYPTMPKREQTIPEDYTAFFREQLRSVETGEKEWKEAVLELFALPGRIPKLPFHRNEIYVYAGKYDSIFEPGKADGEFKFAIPVYCLNENIDSAAREMAVFLQKTAEKFPTLNARVMLSEPPSVSKASAYMTYFGATTPAFNRQIPKGVPVQTWTYANYLCGAEWFNIVSPRGLEKLPLLNEEASRYPDIQVERLASGCVAAKFNKAISTVDIADLAMMKQMLYDALVPGESQLVISEFPNFDFDVYYAKPRMLWENVPVSGDEITVCEDRITIRHL